MEATRTDHDYSLEELYQLLDLVQNELDSMRSNPEMVGTAFSMGATWLDVSVFH